MAVCSWQEVLVWNFPSLICPARISWTKANQNTLPEKDFGFLWSKSAKWTGSTTPKSGGENNGAETFTFFVEELVCANGDGISGHLQQILSTEPKFVCGWLRNGRVGVRMWDANIGRTSLPIPKHGLQKEATNFSTAGQLGQLFSLAPESQTRSLWYLRTMGLRFFPNRP